MSWYDNSTRRKVFLLRHFGVGGAVYSCSRKALILTSKIYKEAWILQASFLRSFPPGMAFSSDHHAGVPNCWAWHSSHVSTSETEGSDRWAPTFPLEFSSTTGSLKVTLLLGRGPSGDLGHLFWELSQGWLWLWALLQLLLLLLEWLLLQLWLWVQEQVCDLPLVLQISLSILLWSASVVSNTLWWATLRASLYGSHLFSLGHHFSWGSESSPIVAGYPNLCIQSFREEMISQIVLLLSWPPQEGRPGGLCNR